MWVSCSGKAGPFLSLLQTGSWHLSNIESSASHQLVVTCSASLQDMVPFGTASTHLQDHTVPIFFRPQAHQTLSNFQCCCSMYSWVQDSLPASVLLHKIMCIQGGVTIDFVFLENRPQNLLQHQIQTSSFRHITAARRHQMILLHNRPKWTTTWESCQRANCPGFLCPTSWCLRAALERENEEQRRVVRIQQLP